MTEFSNRIDSQRNILKIINNSINKNEQLFSLSKKAINRWSSKNLIDPNSELVLNIIKASEKLFFLANKSQEQITSEYKLLSQEVSDITNKIKIQLEANSTTVKQNSKNR
jgi:hypothetical protein